jgi:hypothetical protein
MRPGLKQTFTVKAYDQFGQEIDITDCTWTCTGGTIDTDGVFTAGLDDGNFTVSVTSEDKQDSAGIIITKEEKPVSAPDHPSPTPLAPKS